MKIICSIGPNVKSTQDLKEFVDSGMDCMRLNFSHANYSLATTYINYMRKNHPNIEIVQDLQGNKLRVSNLLKTTFKVNRGDEVVFCSEDYYKRLNPSKGRIIYVPIALDMEFKVLLSAKNLLMKDATMEFCITSKTDQTIVTKVVRGGVIRGEKGINAPGMDRSATKLTSKDKRDIEFGVKSGVDVICLSYTSNKIIIEELRKYINGILEENPSCKMPKIWAKIECGDGVKNIKEILSVTDGIMVGRGDLIAEVPIIEVPAIEKSFMDLMKDMNQELIMATFILESMKNSTLPNISEVSAIARFTQGKVNGIMLAGEVGVGKYPLKVISTAKEIIKKYN